MPIDDCGLKRTAVTRRLQIHRDLDIAQFARKVTRRRVALPKLGQNKPASRIDFARSALVVRVRPRTVVGGRRLLRRERTPSLKPLQHFDVLTDHRGLPIKAAAAEYRVRRWCSPRRSRMRRRPPVRSGCWMRFRRRCWCWALKWVCSRRSSR
jgi:hypothetical protein